MVYATEKKVGKSPRTTTLNTFWISRESRRKMKKKQSQQNEKQREKTKKNDNNKFLFTFELTRVKMNCTIIATT